MKQHLFSKSSFLFRFIPNYFSLLFKKKVYKTIVPKCLGFGVATNLLFNIMSMDNFYSFNPGTFFTGCYCGLHNTICTFPGYLYWNKYLSSKASNLKQNIYVNKKYLFLSFLLGNYFHSSIMEDLSFVNRMFDYMQNGDTRFFSYTLTQKLMFLSLEASFTSIYTTLMYNTLNIIYVIKDFPLLFSSSMHYFLSSLKSDTLSDKKYVQSFSNKNLVPSSYMYQCFKNDQLNLGLYALFAYLTKKQNPLSSSYFSRLLVLQADLCLHFDDVAMASVTALLNEYKPLQEHFLDKAIEQESNKNNLESLALLYAMKIRLHPELKNELWADYGTRFKETDSIESIVLDDYLEGNRGVYTIDESNQDVSLKSLLMLSKTQPTSLKKSLEDELALTNILSEKLVNNTLLSTPLAFTIQDKGDESYLLLLHEWEKRLDMYFNEHNQSQKQLERIYESLYKHTRTIQEIYEKQNDVKLVPVDFEKKYLSENTLLHPLIQDASLIQERIAMFNELGSGSITPLIDPHHKNWLYDHEKNVFTKIDNANGGKAPFMYDLSKLIEHGFDIHSPSQIQHIRNILLKQTQKDFNVQDTELHLMYALAVASLRDSFLQAWTKPHRHSEQNRLKPFLEHTSATLEQLASNVSQGNQSYIQNEMNQTKQYIRHLDDLISFQHKRSSSSTSL